MLNLIIIALCATIMVPATDYSRVSFFVAGWSYALLYTARLVAEKL